MIIYFSGTGNSRYVAKELAKKLHDTCICANDSIKRQKKGFFHGKKPFVFVFPVYLSTIAKIFADFINNSHFEGNQNAYFIATCVGASGSVPNDCKKLCEKKGLNFCGAERVLMPQNYIALFKMTPEEECQRRLAAASEQASALSEIIAKGECFTLSPAPSIEYIATKVVEKLYNGPFTPTRPFHTTDACIGCGLCAKVCPLNRITLIEGKPSWTGSCIHCMSCINHCPKEAIEYGKKTIGKRRYVCKRN